MQTNLLKELKGMMMDDPLDREEGEWLDVLKFGLMPIKGLTSSLVEVSEYSKKEVHR